MEAAPLRNVETTSPGSGPAPADLSPSVAAARIVRRLRHAVDWQWEIGDLLETLGRSLAGHRAILFRLREMPGQGLAQSVAAYWVDDTIEGTGGPPTVIAQAHHPHRSPA